MARILLVDDEPEIVVLTRIILEKEGHEVIVARNSTECFEKLKEGMPDLIFMDIMMPDEDGWKACRKIKADKETKDISVVMFTARASEDLIAMGKECGADAHVGKPFGIKDLIGTVEKVLKNRLPSG